ncbi:MAG: SurA N-terminal domain-containing protein [Pseudomonadota bacterium]
MLQNLREAFIGTTGKVMLAVILLLLAGTGLNYTITPRSFVAKVDGDEIPLRNVNLVYRQIAAQFGNQNLPPEFLRQIQAEAVNRVVTEVALSNHLANTGYAVSDTQIARRIREVPDFQTDGAFDSQLYRSVLAQNSLSPSTFEADERQRMLIGQISENLAASAFVTPEEFRRVIELTNEQREVEYAVLPPELFLEGVVIGDDEVASWYESNPTRYQTPAQASIDYVQVDQNLARERIEIEDAQLRARYEETKNLYETPEQRRARQVLLRTNEDAAAAREQAIGLVARLRAGEPFEDIARTYSQDGGSARQGGDLGWLSPGDYPAGSVDAAIFSQVTNQVSDVVESDFGLHIIQVTDIRSGEIEPFEAVVEDVRRDYLDEQLGAELFALEEALADQLFESDTLEQIAEALGVQIQSVASLNEGAPGPFGPSTDIDEAVFGLERLEPGALSEPISLTGDRTILLRVSERSDAGRQPLEAVAKEIAEELRQQAASDVAAERGAQLAAALSAAPEAEFEPLLADSGATYTAARAVGRADAEAPAALVAAVFAADVPDDGMHVGSVSAPGAGFIVYRISDVIPGSPGDITQQQIEAARSQFARRLGTSDMLALQQGVIDDTSIEIGTALDSQGVGL